MSHMNGFASHGLDEAAFGEKDALSSGLKTFDAFRESPLPFAMLDVQSSLRRLLPHSARTIHRAPSQSSTPQTRQSPKLTPPNSQNQTNLHPPHHNRRLHNPHPPPHLHPALPHRAPPLVRRHRNAALQRRKRGITHPPNQPRHHRSHELPGPTHQRARRVRRPDPRGGHAAAGPDILGAVDGAEARASVVERGRSHDEGAG